MSCLALDSLLTRVHALLTPPPPPEVEGAEGDVEVAVGVYVGVMKALLMRSDVMATTKCTVTGTNSITSAGTSCWQDRFVASLLDLWTTSSPTTSSITAATGSKIGWTAAQAVSTVFHPSSSSPGATSTSFSSLAPAPLLWRQRAWARLVQPLLALAHPQEQPSPPPPSPQQQQLQLPSTPSDPPSTSLSLSSLSQPGLLALCGMIVNLGQVSQSSS